MKRAGCAFVLCVGALALGIGGLAGLRRLRPLLVPPPAAPPPPEPGPEPTPEPTSGPTSRPPPTTLPDEYRSHVGALREFRKWEWGGRYSLGWGFVDHHGRTHQVSCTISRADHERELAGYGYDEDAVRAALDEDLRSYLRRELAARGLSAYVKVSVAGGRVSAEQEFPASDRAEQERVDGEIRRFYALWDDAIPKRRADREAALLKEHGLLLEDDRWGPDYGQLASRATPALGECFRSLEQAGQGYDPRQFLGLFVAFLQEIPYELPPDEIQGRKTAGVWVPTEVLVGNHGDCDSKSVTFAALWLSFGSPVLVIELPRHVLVGAEVRPGPGEKFVLVRNRYFVVGEVAGPGKRRPGDASHEVWQTISGHFRYTLVAPASGREAASERGESGS